MSHPKREHLPAKNQGPFEALGRAWFARHQIKLIWLLNQKYLKGWFRWVLRIHKEVSKDEKIDLILPHAYRVPLGLQKIKGKWMYAYRWDFRTHQKFSKRLYYAFKPIWWAIHFWDWAVADRFVPEWSFGFATLTAYPDANPETTTVDGRVNNDSNNAWATCRGASAGTSINDNESSGQAPSVSWNSGNTNIVRSFFLFDTSPIDDGGVISTATFSQMHAFNSVNNALSTDVVCVSSSPASNTALVTGDFDQVGTTSFGRVNLSAFGSNGDYVDWSLNASGIANISKTGVSKFGLRIGRDFDNAEPASNSASDPISMYFADNTGTTKDPKLVVITGTDYTKTVSDTASVTTSLSKTATKVLSNAIAVTTAMLLTTTKVVADTITMTTAALKTATKVIAEALTTTTDQIALRIKGQTVLDAITTTTDLVRTLSKVVSNTVTVTTTALQTFARVIADTVTVTDSALKTATKVISEAVTTTDSYIRTFFKSVADSLAVTTDLEKLRTALLTVSDIVATTTVATSLRIKNLAVTNVVRVYAQTRLLALSINSILINLLWRNRIKPSTTWTKRTKPTTTWTKRDIP